MDKCRTYWMLVFTILIGTGCVDTFEIPTSATNNNILVVEGRISDTETFIKLSRTSNLDSINVIPERFARVSVENQAGSQRLVLNEQIDGEYSIDNLFNVGESYRVRIETQDGEIYQSAFSEMIQTPPISSIDTELDSGALKLNFLLSTMDIENDSRYYLWTYDETYEYTSAYNSLIEYENQELSRREDQIFRCWRTNRSTDILTGTSINLELDVISDKEIVSHILPENQKFNVAYSLNILQFAITPEEFEFWTLLETNTETLGTLFDPQPSELTSNLTCISNPNLRVIGWVGSSTKSELRSPFVRRSDLPRDMPLFRYSNCEPDTISTDPLDIIQQFEDPGFLPIQYWRSEETGDTLGVVYGRSFCVDCLEQGGTSLKPEYWF